MPRVSVVIPCYNRASLVSAAIESALAQTEPPYEIVVVDDQSTDGSADVIAQYPVQLVRADTKLYQGGARNLAARLATGEFLAFLDSDDLWDSHHLAAHMRLIERFPNAAGTFSGVRYLGGRLNGQIALPRFPADCAFDAFDIVLRRMPGYTMASMVRSRAFAEAGGFPEDPAHRAEDYELFLKLAARHPYACTHDITATYRFHGDQLSDRPDLQIASTYAARYNVWRTFQQDASPRAPHIARRSAEEWRADIAEAFAARDVDGIAQRWALRRYVPWLGLGDRATWFGRLQAARAARWGMRRVRG